MVTWLQWRLRSCREVNLDEVMRQCPSAHAAMQKKPGLLSVVLGMISSEAKASNIVLTRVSDRLAFRRYSSLGEAARLEGFAEVASTEEGELKEDPAAAVKKLIDYVANVWGIQLLPSQQVTGAKKGEVPRALTKLTTADGELKALHSILGSLEVMARGYTLHRLCASGTDANIFACLVRLALRCG